MKCGKRKIVEHRGAPLGGVVRLAKELCGNAWHIAEIIFCSEPLGNLKQREFALASDDRIHVWLVQRLAGEQAGMPTTEDDGDLGIVLFDALRDANRAANHGAGEERNSQAQGAADFAKDTRFEIRNNRRVNDADFESRFEERGRKAEKTKWRAERRAIVGGVDKNDFALGDHAAPDVAGSRRFASTTGFRAAVLRFSFSLIHNSTGRAYTSWSSLQRAGIENDFWMSRVDRLRVSAPMGK